MSKFGGETRIMGMPTDTLQGPPRRYGRLIAPTLFALSTLLLLSTPQRAVADGSKSGGLPPGIDATIGKLDELAGGYPPNADTPRAVARARRLARSAIGQLKRYAAAHGDWWGIEYRLGDCYRIGHNVDLSGAYEGAQSHLKKAIEMAPKEPAPLVQLGWLYVNSDPARGGDIERLLLRAIELAKPNRLIEAHRGLVYGCYYQAKWDDAIKEADFCLAANPKDEGIKRMKEFAVSRRDGTQSGSNRATK